MSEDLLNRSPLPFDRVRLVNPITKRDKDVSYSQQFNGGIFLEEESDVIVRVLTVSDNSTIVTAEFEYLLVMEGDV